MVNTWCNTWGMKVNGNKSKVVQFRGTHIHPCQISLCGQKVLEAVRDYKYLGLLLNEFLDFKCRPIRVRLSPNLQIEFWV